MTSLTLNEKHYLASGGNRHFYLHPKNKRLGIKVNKDIKEKNRNKTEEIFFQKYPCLNFLPYCYGIVDTNYGSGLVVDLIFDFNGDISKSLQYYLDSGEFSLEKVNEYINALEEKITKSGILIHDDGLQNILMKKDFDGSFTPYLVDGFGPRSTKIDDWLKFAIPQIARKKSLVVLKKMKIKAIKRASQVQDKVCGSNSNDN